MLNRGFAAAFTSAFPGAIDFATVRDTALRSLAELVRRAKATGRLRADFTVDDLVLLLMASGGVRVATPKAARRFATLLLEGLAS